MPLRLAAFPSLINPPQCPSSFLHRVPLSRFHASSSQWKSDNNDLYETLGLKPDASPASIKKQFYTLSKLHHPDHNSSDPSASARFMKISSAYATLGVPTKREKYDREHIHIQTASRPAGSHSSASGGSGSNSGPYGSRPASGLSRRRTQFRGPPPSFYRSGGWGTQEAKRAQAQQQGNNNASSSSSYADAFGAGSSSSSSSSDPGMGPGQSRLRWENDVPHFDREIHFRTQEQQDLRRRMRMEEESGRHDYGSGGDILLKFVLVSGVVLVGCAVPGMFTG